MIDEDLYKVAEERCKVLLRSDKAYNGLSNTDFWKDGYEQGYEDCRHYAHDYYKPKWHDLRKNPEDLPKERKMVLLCIEVAGRLENSKIYIAGIYNKGECLGEYDSCWLYQEADKKVLTEIVDNQRVIAWCELPKFEE